MTDQPPKTPPKEKRDGIPVRSLTFKAFTRLPGRSGDSLTAKDQANVERHEIVYEPWLQSFRVTYFPASNEGKREVSYVTVSAVATWTPL